jgi:hypothetical protein
MELSQSAFFYPGDPLLNWFGLGQSLLTFRTMTSSPFFES